MKLNRTSRAFGAVLLAVLALGQRVPTATAATKAPSHASDVKRIQLMGNHGWLIPAASVTPGAKDESVNPGANAWIFSSLGHQPIPDLAAATPPKAECAGCHIAGSSLTRLRF